MRASQRWQAAGQTGAVRATTNDPALIKTVMTFSEPDPIFSVPNPDCPTAADCTAHPAALTRPVFSIATYGFWDSIIASPATERAFFLGTSVHAALGIILSSDGKPATTPRSRTPHRQPRAVCSVTPRPGWNTSCAATRLRPPSPGRIRSWSRKLTGQAALPSEPGASGKGARAGKYQEPCERRSRQKPTQNTRIWEAADRASRQHDPAHSGSRRSSDSRLATERVRRAGWAQRPAISPVRCSRSARR